MSDDELAVIGDPLRHRFDTNGFPVEQCLKCGWLEDAHKPLGDTPASGITPM